MLDAALLAAGGCDDGERQRRRAEQALYANVRNLFGGRLRQAVTGAAPIAPGILKFLFACGVPVMEGYGLTETASVASVNTPDAFRLGSVGRPLPGVQVRITGDGEILIKGPNVFKGYYRDARATPETLVDGWLHTGDLGRLDENGFCTSPAARRTSSSRPGARTSRLRTSRTGCDTPAGSRTPS
jgi:long-subunit acyl-CoA synthetase (AMP-forming)